MTAQQKSYLLAHDLGTTGNKAVLYSVEGRIVSDSFSAYGTQHPRPGFVEQDPEDWWNAVCASTRELLSREGIDPSSVAAVSFSAQMMGCLIVDSQGKPLRPSIIWADTRAAEETAEIASRIDRKRVYEITGHRLSSSYSAAKLLWIRNREPALFERAHKMLQAKDFIVYRLTGEFATDYSDASGTNMFDLREKRWSREILDAIGIAEEILPRPVASTTVIGSVTAGAAAEAGLTAGTPVVIGGGDGACATVGAGVIRSGRAYNVIGTSSWIAMASREPVMDREERTFNWVHLDQNLYMPCGTMQSAGFSYSWFKDALCDLESREAQAAGTNVYDTLNRYVEECAPGAGGLLFLPYLLGERSPWWEPEARAAFIGLGAEHTRAHMTRAVLEGVAHNLRIILNAFDHDQRIEELTLIGGGARNAAWTQILADVWNRPLEVPAAVEDATSMGAAICAGVGIGVFSGFDIAEELVIAERRVEPDPDRVALYEKMHPVFLHAYRALEPVFRDLSPFRSEAGDS
jgi:xylulokinase